MNLVTSGAEPDKHFSIQRYHCYYSIYPVTQSLVDIFKIYIYLHLFIKKVVRQRDARSITWPSVVYHHHVINCRMSWKLYGTLLSWQDKMIIMYINVKSTIPHMVVWVYFETNYHQNIVSYIYIKLEYWYTISAEISKFWHFYPAIFFKRCYIL